MNKGTYNTETDHDTEAGIWKGQITLLNFCTSFLLSHNALTGSHWIAQRQLRVVKGIILLHCLDVHVLQFRYAVPTALLFVLKACSPTQSSVLLWEVFGSGKVCSNQWTNPLKVLSFYDIIIHWCKWVIWLQEVGISFKKHIWSIYRNRSELAT